MFAGKGFTLEDAQWMLPFIDVTVRDDDLTDADSAQTFVSDKTFPCAILATLGVADIQQAWTLSTADATGLTFRLGYQTDDDFALAAGNVIGASAGLSLLGGGGVGDLIVAANRAAAFVAAGTYVPQMVATATGGATPEVNEATAGLIIGRTYFLACPLNFADYNVNS